MTTQLANSEVTTAQSVFVKMALDAWHSHNKRVTDLIEHLTDEEIQSATAPGRNTGTYLLGHLTAVNDAMIPMFGFGEKMYPEMENVFLRTPDQSGQTMPSVAELKSRWNAVNAKLNAHISKMQPEEWFTKHASVSAEDFAKEPHRNKLNVILSRTSHQGYHLGQMMYLKKK